MLKYLFIVFSLFCSVATCTEKKSQSSGFFTNSHVDNCQTSHSYKEDESKFSSEFLIEFDDFPDNSPPGEECTNPQLELDSELVSQKNSHDFISLPDEDEIISLQNEIGIDIHGYPSVLVSGCVNVISGEYQETAIDLSIPGVSPLNIQRNYFGGKCKKNSFLFGWQLNHGAKLFSYWSKHNHFYAFIKGSERHGVFYKELDTAKGHFSCPPAFFNKGVTNCGLGEISAKTNLKNDRLYNLVGDRFNSIQEINLVLILSNRHTILREYLVPS